MKAATYGWARRLAAIRVWGAHHEEHLLGRLSAQTIVSSGYMKTKQQSPKKTSVVTL